MATSAHCEVLSTLLRTTTVVLDTLDACLWWAEDEISQAMNRHPDHADTLFHSFLLLTPTHTLMGTEFVFRSHCRELLERVAAGEDTRSGTAAEVCCACHDISLVTPLSSPATGLYFRMWSHAFPDQPMFGSSLAHHEALEGSTIDDLEAIARRKLGVSHRKLGEIECVGRHHGQAVRCPYAHPIQETLPLTP
ncbi:hypothetical protein GCM10012275_54260 [Longimycelium tulufanense]|uniref:Uncharacterized protein n=1 Tax=Longimycelium tulufanense TaxID=907463 RepID=A0A8J3FYK9_9PSEU|nr:hypothetical protein [Longimycelium tulufanense]GGM76678.1 hypothetical protein GCM10012275_54260 [Longimycelium tulufanense]